MKYFSLLLVLITFNFQSIGQVWIDEGAVWHYEYSNIGYGGFTKYEYTKDTIIEGQTCEKIDAVYYEFTSDQYGNIVPLGQFGRKTNYTYVSGDTVFYWNDIENKFFTLYNFGAEVGDSWIIASENYGYGFPLETDNDTSRIEVVATGTIEINSDTYRTITIQPTYGSTFGMKGIYVERFGNINSNNSSFQYLFPSYYAYEEPEDVIVEWDGMRFNCFQDNSFDLYNITNRDCEYLLSLEEEITLTNIEYYPNPTRGKINITNSNNEKIVMELLDVQGKLLKTVNIEPISQNLLDLSIYHNGIYFIKFTGESNRNKTAKFIKQ